MKKILLLLVSYLFVLQALGQEKKMAIGVQVTPTISNLYTNLDDDFKPVVAYSVGATFDYIISDHLKLNTGLGFEQKGASSDYIKVDGTGHGVPSTLKYEYNYLSIPLMITYKSNGERYFYVGGGPFINFLIGSRIIIDEGMPGDTTPYSNKLELGLGLIAGFVIPLNDQFDFDLGLRDNLGLTGIGGGAQTGTNTIGLQTALKYKF